MKKLLVVLVLGLSMTGMADETKKAYEEYWVTITSSFVNQNGVRLIYGHGSLNGEGKQRNFIFQCNDDTSTCSAPAIGKRYSLIGTDVPYNCDDYILDPLPWYSRPQVVACLDSVH